MHEGEIKTLRIKRTKVMTKRGGEGEANDNDGVVIVLWAVFMNHGRTVHGEGSTRNMQDDGGCRIAGV